MTKEIWEEFADIIIGTTTGIIMISLFFKNLPLISSVFGILIKGFMG